PDRGVRRRARRPGGGLPCGGGGLSCRVRASVQPTSCSGWVRSALLCGTRRDPRSGLPVGSSVRLVAPTGRFTTPSAPLLWDAARQRGVSNQETREGPCTVVRSPKYSTSCP